MSRGMPEGFDAAQQEYDNRLPSDDDDSGEDDFDPETDHDCYCAEPDYEAMLDSRSDLYNEQYGDWM